MSDHPRLTSSALAIQREIDDRISDLFLSGALGDGEAVRADAADDEFVVTSVPNATVQLPTAA